MTHVSLTEVARQVDVSQGTLRRWAREGIVPLEDGEWTPAAVAHARIVARLRDRGHSLGDIRRASAAGRLAHGYIGDLFPSPVAEVSLEDAAQQTGLEPALIERIWTSVGFPAHLLERLTEDDLELLRSIGTVLGAGFPLVAFLQLIRVYGQAVAGSPTPRSSSSTSSCTSR